MAPRLKSAFIDFVDYIRADCKDAVAQEAVDKIKSLDHDAKALSRMQDGWSRCSSKRVTMDLNIVDELLNTPDSKCART